VVTDALVVGDTAGIVGVVVFGRVGDGPRVVEVASAVEVVVAAAVVVVASLDVVVSRDVGVVRDVAVTSGAVASAVPSEATVVFVALVDDRGRAVVAFEPHAASAVASARTSTAARRERRRIPIGSPPISGLPPHTVAAASSSPRAGDPRRLGTGRPPRGHA
jgi:hypothetical protein